MSDQTHPPVYRDVAVLRRLYSRTVLDAETGCLFWEGARSADGYGLMRIRGTLHYTHRLSLAMRLGRPLEAMALHRCDTPSCLNPDHLFEGDDAANLQDAARKGRCRHRVLTSDQVRQIKRRLLLGETWQSLAETFGVSTSSIGHIAHGRNWAHVEAA